MHTADELRARLTALESLPCLGRGRPRKEVGIDRDDSALVSRQKRRIRRLLKELETGRAVSRASLG